MDAALAHTQDGECVKTRYRPLIDRLFVLASCGENVALEVVFRTDCNLIRLYLYDVERGFWDAHR